MGGLSCSCKEGDGGAEYRVWVEGQWWSVRSLGSIAGTSRNHCVEDGRSKMGNEGRRCPVNGTFPDGASKGHAAGEGGYESGLAHAGDAAFARE
jgi:hypothetical protein